MDGTVLKSMIRSLFSSRSPFIVSLLNSAFYNRRLTISPTLQTDALLSSFPAGSRFSDIHTHTHADSSSTHIQSRLAVLICCCRFLPKKILRPAPYIHYPLVLLFSLFLSLSLAFVLWHFLDISIEFIHLPIFLNEAENNHFLIGLFCFFTFWDFAVAFDVGPGVNPRRPEDERDHPGSGNHDAGPTRCPSSSVCERPRHREISEKKNEKDYRSIHKSLSRRRKVSNPS